MRSFSLKLVYVRPLRLLCFLQEAFRSFVKLSGSYSLFLSFIGFPLAF